MHGCGMASSLVLAACLGILATAAPAAPLQVCLVSGSFEYDSDTSLAAFQEYLETRHDVQCTLLKATGWTDIPGLEALDTCDVALFFLRRLRLEGEQLERIKAYCAAGRPLVAVRTMSHGIQTWLEFDKEVLGGNYQGHLGEGPTTEVLAKPRRADHPVLEGVGPIRSRYSLYKTGPVADDCDVLMFGRTPVSDGPQPLAWTRVHNGGRVFYTSLGGVGDFEGASFRRLLANALYWAAEQPAARKPLPPVTRRPRPEGVLTLALRARAQDAAGAWAERALTREWPVTDTAVIVCDMWDKHWCDFANARVAEMAPRMAEVLNAARGAGVQIIHCPSETLGFYQDWPQRRRMQAAPPVAPPDQKTVADPPLPIDDSDGGCPGPEQPYAAWTRQTATLPVGEYDGISDDGREVYHFLAQEGITHVIIMGVHTNMCVLNRSFGIRQLSRWGLDCCLVRDLTDTMYNPAMPPRIPHDEGTDLVVQHIEKYWCPSLTSEDLLAGLPG
ncbi:MAG: isochorismatase family protein [Candidatus Hydrogenedentes bacterium]|nr:isochorismatase family protein [Candidatus Hydrogenedentota bacterium]